MKTDITTALVEEHRLILRMIALLEENAPRTGEGEYRNWRFYRDGIDFIRQYLSLPYRPYRKPLVFA